MSNRRAPISTSNSNSNVTSSSGISYQTFISDSSAPSSVNHNFELEPLLSASTSPTASQTSMSYARSSAPSTTSTYLNVSPLSQSRRPPISEELAPSDPIIRGNAEFDGYSSSYIDIGRRPGSPDVRITQASPLENALGTSSDRAIENFLCQSERARWIQTLETLNRIRNSIASFHDMVSRQVHRYTEHDNNGDSNGHQHEDDQDMMPFTGWDDKTY